MNDKFLKAPGLVAKMFAEYVRLDTENRDLLKRNTLLQHERDNAYLAVESFQAASVFIPDNAPPQFIAHYDAGVKLARKIK